MLRESDYLRLEAARARLDLARSFADLRTGLATAVHPRNALRLRNLPVTITAAVGFALAFWLWTRLPRRPSSTSGGVREPRGTTSELVRGLTAGATAAVLGRVLQAPNPGDFEA